MQQDCPKSSIKSVDSLLMWKKIMYYLKKQGKKQSTWTTIGVDLQEPSNFKGCNINAIPAGMISCPSPAPLQTSSQAFKNAFQEKMKNKILNITIFLETMSKDFIYITSTNLSFTWESSVTPSPTAPYWVTSKAFEYVKIWRMNTEKIKIEVFFCICFEEE